jgi:flavin reductase (DIM6/NTAB) family NADH-FMN oxidoreductase RutF
MEEIAASASQVGNGDGRRTDAAREAGRERDFERPRLHLAPRADVGAPARASEPLEFRRALGCFPTGVTVVTTAGVDPPYGVTVNAFTSVSLTPPLVLVCLRHESSGLEAIERNGVFAVNVLSDRQEALSRRFAARDRVRGAEAFAGTQHFVAVTGSPILAGVACSVDCRLVSVNVAGDHAVLIGEALRLEGDPDANPLLFP